MNKKVKLPYPIVIHDILLLLSVIFSLIFFSFYTIFPHFDIAATPIKATLIVLTFIAFLISFTSYLFIEYHRNRLSFKNIFFYIAIAIVVINLIAVASLPSKINLPNSGLLEIFALDRTYYLLSGITFASLPVTFFYLIPRRVNNRHYVNVILIGIVLITAICILVSFIMDYQAYVKIFSSHFKDIQDVQIGSLFGVKNIFARVLLTGIIASTFLHLRTKNWKWLLLLIPFVFILILTASYMSLLLCVLYLFIYLVIRLVLLAKKNKDNLILVSLIGGFVLLLVVYFSSMIAISTDGILFMIKDFINKAVEHVKTTFESRQVIWSCALNLLAPYQFVFGFGVASFGMALHLTYTPIAPEWDKSTYHAHNGGIELIGRGGALLLLIYLFLYAYLIYLSIKLYKKKPIVASIGLIVIVGQIINSLVEPFFVCNGYDITTTLLITLPIISEYYLLYGKEKSMRDDIVKSANKLKSKSDSKLFNLNKKCLLIEAKHISEDLKEKY